MNSFLLVADSAAGSAIPPILDDLQRVHLQLGLLEYRSAVVNGAYSEHARRLSELGEEVRGIMQRLEHAANGSAEPN